MVIVCLLVAVHSGADAQTAGGRPRQKETKPATVATFADITSAAGIDFHLTCGSPDKQYIMDSMCGGVAAFDYDNDGWMDILLVNGSTLEDVQSGKCHSSKLYRNNRDGTFADVTAKAGLAHCGWGFGAAFGDYDNDGYHDLYVVNYVDLDLKHLPRFGEGPYCQYRGIPVSCGPRGLKGGRDRLYHNNGNGTFSDVTEKLNIDPNSSFGLGVIWLDYDLDGCLDLYVADDSSPSMLYHNDCKGGFTEVGTEAGTAYSADGKEQAGMGIDSVDYDNDGWPDIVKTNFSDDSNNLYHNDHRGEFTDMAGPANFGSISIPFLAFGVKFLDLDNDGWKDIFVANGHVNPQVDQHSFGTTYAERPFLFHNLRNGKFEEIGERVGSNLPAQANPASGKTEARGSTSPVAERRNIDSPGRKPRVGDKTTESRRDGA